MICNPISDIFSTISKGYQYSHVYYSINHNAQIINKHLAVLMNKEDMVHLSIHIWIQWVDKHIPWNVLWLLVRRKTCHL